MRRFLEQRPAAVLIFISFLWGSTFVVTKDVIRTLPPLPYLLTRFSIATLVLLCLYPSSLRAPRRTLTDGAFLGVMQALGLVLQVAGQVYTTASKSSFVTSLNAPLTPLLVLLLYRERPRREQLAGVALATVGLVLLTYPGADAAWNRGDLFTVACAFVYAAVIVETARRAPHSEVAAFTTLQTLFATLTLLALLTIERGGLYVFQPEHLPHLLLLEARPFALDGKLASQILYMALVCTVFTFSAQTWAMSRLSATHAALVFSLEPVFATGLGIAMDGASERPDLRGTVGAGLILVGLVLPELRLRMALTKT